YAFCLVESHSRKMYLEFTHSQSCETFARCHIHAFQSLVVSARKSGLIISPPPSPNTKATWCGSARASSPLLASFISSPVDPVVALDLTISKQRSGLFHTFDLPARPRCFPGRGEISGGALNL